MQSYGSLYFHYTNANALQINWSHLKRLTKYNYVINIFYFPVCSSYITLPALNETKLLNQYSCISCSSEQKLFSFEHSVTLSGIRIFFDDVKQKPSVEFECHLNHTITALKVICKLWYKWNTFIYYYYYYYYYWQYLKRLNTIQ